MQYLAFTAFIVLIVLAFGLPSPVCAGAAFVIAVAYLALSKDTVL